MQFIVMGYDGADSGAMERRLAVREAHLAGAEAMYREGTLLYAGALLDAGGGMIGSVMVVEFPSEADLRAGWLETEPYVVGDVRRQIEVRPVQTAGFIKKP